MDSEAISLIELAQPFGFQALEWRLKDPANVLISKCKVNTIIAGPDPKRLLAIYGEESLLNLGILNASQNPQCNPGTILAFSAANPEDEFDLQECCPGCRVRCRELQPRASILRYCCPITQTNCDLPSIPV